MMLYLTVPLLLQVHKHENYAEAKKKVIFCPSLFCLCQSAVTDKSETDYWDVFLLYT